MSGPAPAPARNPAAEFKSSLDKSKFIKDVAVVPWFSVGKPGAPVVYMIADPLCPYCHRMWQTLAPRVAKGDFAVNVILIDGLPGSHDAAISLLSRPNISAVWESGEGSSDAPIAPPPPPAAPGSQDEKAQKTVQGWLARNDAFAHSVNITSTPLLAYVGKDGVLYSAEGPRDIDAFLSAL